VTPPNSRFVELGRRNGPSFRIAEIEPPCEGGFWVAVLPGEHCYIIDLDAGLAHVYSARERANGATAKPAHPQGSEREPSEGSAAGFGDQTLLPLD